MISFFNRQIEVRSALFSWNVNKLWRVFSPFKKFGDFFRKNAWNIFGAQIREKWCFSWCFDSWLSILWVPFFQGLLRFLSHCPIKKDDIMYVIFSKIESLEKVCHCCSFCQMCLMPKKLLTTEVVFTGSCKLKSQNCSRHPLQLIRKL